MRVSILLLLLCATPALAAGDLARKAGLEEFDQKAPELVLHGPSDKTERLSALHGNGVILHFWATWCTSCRKELPALAAMVKGSGVSQLRFLPVSIDGERKRAEVEKLLGPLGLADRAWIAEKTDESKPYWAWGVPMTYFIDSDGKIVARAMGAKNWTAPPKAELEAFLKSLARPAAQKR